MANVMAPKGFIALRNLDGSPFTGALRQYLIPSSDGTAIGIGDVVKSGGSSGAAGVVVGGMDVEGMPTAIKVASGTTGQDIIGVVQGFLVDPTSLQTKHRAASTNRVALVVPVETAIFEIQEDALVTPVAAASVGLNAAFTVGTVSTTTGLTNAALDSDSVNTTVTLPLRVLGLTKRAGNAFNTGGAGVDAAWFEVIFNTFWFAPNTVGA